MFGLIFEKSRKEVRQTESCERQEDSRFSFFELSLGFRARKTFLHIWGQNSLCRHRRKHVFPQEIIIDLKKSLFLRFFASLIIHSRNWRDINIIKESSFHEFPQMWWSAKKEKESEIESQKHQKLMHPFLPSRDCKDSKLILRQKMKNKKFKFLTGKGGEWLQCMPSWEYSGSLVFRSLQAWDFFWRWCRFLVTSQVMNSQVRLDKTFIAKNNDTHCHSFAVFFPFCLKKLQFWLGNRFWEREEHSLILNSFCFKTSESRDARRGRLVTFSDISRNQWDNAKKKQTSSFFLCLFCVNLWLFLLPNIVRALQFHAWRISTTSDTKGRHLRNYWEFMRERSSKMGEDDSMWMTSCSFFWQSFRERERERERERDNHEKRRR
jgi:hypothetical protein